MHPLEICALLGMVLKKRRYVCDVFRNCVGQKDEVMARDFLFYCFYSVSFLCCFFNLPYIHARLFLLFESLSLISLSGRLCASERIPSKRLTQTHRRLMVVVKVQRTYPKWCVFVCACVCIYIRLLEFWCECVIITCPHPYTTLHTLLPLFATAETKRRAARLGQTLYAATLHQNDWS